MMLKYFIPFLFIMLALGSCKNPLKGSSGGISPPQVSHILEDNGGQKFFVKRNVLQNEHALFKWDIVAKQWSHVLSVSAANKGGASFFIDERNPTAQSFSLYDSYQKKLFTTDILTGQETVQQLSDNYSILSADVFAVYEAGDQVWTYQVSTGAMTYLHSLPSLAAVNGGLGLNLVDVNQYKMLCTPSLVNGIWDYQTHFCILANSVEYPRNNTFAPKNNHYYELNVVVNANGQYSYQLFLENFLAGTISLVERLFFSPIDQLKKEPAYAPLITGVSTIKSDTFSIDSQGGLHLFYTLKELGLVHYQFYTIADLTTPIYTQILP